ncbi:jg25859 [Pararge aegeria aegeria]|uniref:Jg25859 protein n=1 Tax=Pararge aegeria aegeria TaxID=348720 RepID=A0A8S4RTD2_9NEOP|nr:jg25859 [Pararge aegeria aegeria]
MQNSIWHQSFPIRTTQTKMFKLVVLCAFLAAAVAEPSGLFAPLAYSTSFLAPARTTITNQASSVIHPSPFAYSAPWAYNAPLGHLIKKRSPSVVSSYIAPSTYIAHSPIATTYAASPFAYTSYSPLATTYGAPIYTTAAHFIKKRSALFYGPTTYVAPSAYHAPLLTPTYTAPIYSTPYVSSAPITYTHLIKKRSAPFALTAYAAPAAFSHQSRVDIKSSPAVATYSYSSPITYASPYGFTRLI